MVLTNKNIRVTIIYPDGGGAALALLGNALPNDGEAA